MTKGLNQVTTISVLNLQSIVESEYGWLSLADTVQNNLLFRGS